MISEIQSTCVDAIDICKKSGKVFTFYFNEVKMVVNEHSTCESLVGHYYHNVNLDKYFK